MFAHPIRQRSRQLDGEHHVGLGNFNPSSSHGLLHIPACLPHRHAVPTGHRASDGDGGHARPDQIGGGIDPPGVFDAIDTATTNHATNLLPIMTLLTLSARKKFQPPVAQRHLETEVAHCVGGVRIPPCGVPLVASCMLPSSARMPACKNALTSPRTRLSLTHLRTLPISAECEISSKQAVMSASSTHS